MEERNLTRVENNEVDLMDLFKILYKNKLMIATITIVVTMLSLGGALYVRANNPTVTAVDYQSYDWKADFYARKAGVQNEIFDERRALNDDEILQEMFNLEGLSKLFKESGEEDNVENKRRFLQDIIERSDTYDDGKNYLYSTFKAKSDSEVLNTKILGHYLSILNKAKEESLKEVIEDNISHSEKNYEDALNQLSKVDKELSRAISGESKEMLSSNSAAETIRMKYGKLVSQQDMAKGIYKQSADEFSGFEGLQSHVRANDQIRVVSSYYEVQNKSKAKMIMVLGVLMGIILGIMAAFMREFWKHFKVSLDAERKQRG